MKKIILSSVVATFAITASYVAFNSQSEKSATYVPRELSEGNLAQSYQGGAEYVRMMRANQVTGVVDPNDVLKARKKVEALRAQKAGALGIDWLNIGPYRQGGRTRAIVIDKDDRKKIYMGSVSGGLFVSTDGANHWEPILDDDLNVLSISCMAQGSDGTLWIGTGCAFEDAYANGGSGFIGGGLYKMVDGDITKVIGPTTANESATAWAMVNEVAVDPNNSSRIYAATNRGLMMSTDKGATWDNAHKINNCSIAQSGMAQDVKVLSDGSVIMVYANKIWMSPTGDQCTFVNKPGVTGSERIDLAIAPSNNNYIYAIAEASGELGGLYRSTDKGETWTLLQGEIPAYFEPCNGQCNYDFTLAVEPTDENFVWIGAVQLWQWDGDLTRIADEFGGGGQWGDDDIGITVHSDKHTIVFDEQNPGLAYIGSDGGVHIANYNVNGVDHNYVEANRGYITTQFYSVAHDYDGKVMGGTQDNGTWEIREETGYVGDQVQGGDGYDCVYSQITNRRFASLYFDQVTRGVDDVPSALGGFATGFIYEAPTSTSDTVLLKAVDYAADGGDFYSRIALWETPNDPNSQWTVNLIAKDEEAGIATGNGTKVTFTGTIETADPKAKIYPGSVIVKNGAQTLTDAGASILDDSYPLTGDGDPNNSSIDYGTKTVTVAFNTAPAANSKIAVYYSVYYTAGTEVVVESNTKGINLKHTLTADLNPKDTLFFTDPVQSLFASAFTRGGSGTSLALTRHALTNKEKIIWMEITNIGTPLAMEFSKDGKHLFVGNKEGEVWRVSNLENLYNKTLPAVTATKTRIFNGSQTVTGIDVDPNNPDNVVITLGNYGNTNYVYRTKTATTATSTSSVGSFVSIQGNLPEMPVYDVIIDVNGKGLVIGTEFGVFTSSNGISENVGSNVTWSVENGSMGPVPVFEITQQYHPYEISSRKGELYLGTHGKGFWKSTSLVNTKEVEEFVTADKFQAGLTIFPNPMNAYGTVAINVSSAIKGSLTVVDINGRMVKDLGNLTFNSGTNLVSLETSEWSVGTYMAVLRTDKEVKVSKFMVNR